MPESETIMILPFKEEWTVGWGGDTEHHNYHVVNKKQQGAFDLIVVGNGNKTFRNDGKTNADYYAFGKEIIAPCDGIIVEVIDGVKDNVPGILNKNQIHGNSILFKTTKGEFIRFSHFQMNSVNVQQDQKVTKGDLLGLCGNSGHSTEPHLHFHLENNEGVGIKSFFQNILVNGELKENYSPVKGEKIQNK
jgi:murein DD-endopeptidase MepM/ murein hydrolase activator NlpD